MRMGPSSFHTPCVSTPQGSTTTKAMTREEILAAREGYAQAMQHATGITRAHCESMAAGKYPLPKKIVPRKVTLPSGGEYTFENGKFMYRRDGYGPGSMSNIFNSVSAETVRAILALKDNPTCEVEE